MNEKDRIRSFITTIAFDKRGERRVFRRRPRQMPARRIIAISSFMIFLLAGVALGGCTTETAGLSRKPGNTSQSISSIKQAPDQPLWVF
jgi:hypothetical protein